MKARIEDIKFKVEIRVQSLNRITSLNKNNKHVDDEIKE